MAFVNQDLSEVSIVKKIAHELYGHVYPFFVGNRYLHEIIGDEFDLRILDIETNAENNYYQNIKK
jgi:hypothetical protein